MRGADIVASGLAAAGVERIFSLSGNQIMPLYDACLDAGIVIHHTRHEAAAVYMAEAWAQLTGGLGVALLTAGPGAANGLAPIFTARASESPVLILTGDAPLAADGTGAFQEMDQVAMTAPLTKRSFRARTVETLGANIAGAVATALSGRPGPVHVALPFDILQARGEPTAPPRPEATNGALDIGAITARIAAARRPLILLGPALNETRAPGLAARLQDASGAPVLALESPRGLRDPAIGAAARAFGSADLAVSLGKAIDFTTGHGAAPPFASDCRWVVVDAEPAALDRARRNLGDRARALIAADPRRAAEGLAAAAFPPRAPDWREEVAALAAMRAQPPEASTPEAITPAALCAAVQRRIAAAGDATLICDGGEFGQWAQACLSAPRRIINGPSGAIGGGLCYAIAASLARPGAPVFALMGDGTAGFHLSEFETAAREGAAFVAVIGNDGRWNAEHQIQLRDYGEDRLHACALSGARYDQAAAALGGHGEYVREIGALDAALDRALASGKPACVNVEIEGAAAPNP